MKKDEIKKIIDESGKRTEVHYEGKDRRTSSDESQGVKMGLINSVIGDRGDEISHVLNNGEITNEWVEFFDFKRKFDKKYGSIKIDRNLISVSTGGWSENEDLLNEFKNSFFYLLYFSHMSTGGHYYLDTDKNSTKTKHWKIIKE